jgi:ribosome-associated protein
MWFKHINIPDSEIIVKAIHSQGAGGQNVNKVSTAIQLKFDIAASSLPEVVKKRLLMLHDRRVTEEGILIIKAQETRSQLRNRQLAMERLREFVEQGFIVARKRKKTRPTRAAKIKRLNNKRKRGELKKSRQKKGLQD